MRKLPRDWQKSSYLLTTSCQDSFCKINMGVSFNPFRRKDILTVMFLFLRHDATPVDYEGEEQADDEGGAAEYGS